MRVYRLERNGKGPYSFYKDIRSEEERELYISLQDAHTFNPNNPTPSYDGLHMPDDLWLCACTSMEALEGWFGEFLEQFKRIGFEVKEYTVSKDSVKIGKSNRQCVFDSKPEYVRPDKQLDWWVD